MHGNLPKWRWSGDMRDMGTTADPDPYPNPSGWERPALAIVVSVASPEKSVASEEPTGEVMLWPVASALDSARWGRDLMFMGLDDDDM